MCSAPCAVHTQCIRCHVCWWKNILWFNLDSINFSRSTELCPVCLGWWTNWIYRIHDSPDGIVCALSVWRTLPSHSVLFSVVCMFSRMEKSAATLKYDKKKETEEMKSFHELAVFVVGRSKWSICHLLCSPKKKSDGELIGLETQSIVHVFINRKRKKEKKHKFSTFAQIL